MKRVRNDHIQSTMNIYMKRRAHNFSSTLSRSDSVKETQGVRGTSLTSSVKSNHSGIFSYSPVSLDCSLFDQQFARFKRFVEDPHGAHQSELRKILFSIFAHMYLEMFYNGHKAQANKFYSRHVAMLHEDMADKTYTDFLEKLHTSGEAYTPREITKFRNKKNTIYLSSAAISHMMNFLKTDNNLCILHILNAHLTLRVKTENRTNFLSPTSRVAGRPPTIPPSPPLTPDVKVIENESRLSTLKSCIARLGTCPPMPPSVCLYTLHHAQTGVCSAEFNSDTTKICSASEDASINVWSLTNRGLITRSVLPETTRISLATDIFEQHTSDNENANDTVTEQRLSLCGHSASVYQSVFVDNDRYLLSCSEDTTIRLWNLFTRNNVVIYRGHNSPVWDIHYSSTGNVFVSASRDKTVKLWTTDKVYPLRSYIGHTLDVDCVRFHANGTYIASASCDKTLRLWSLNDAKCVRLFNGHSKRINAISFSPNGQSIMSIGEDRSMKLWDLGSGKVIMDWTLPSTFSTCVTFNPFGTLVAVGDIEGNIKVYDIVADGNLNSCSMKGETKADTCIATYSVGVSVLSCKFSHHNTLYAAAKTTQT